MTAGMSSRSLRSKAAQARWFRSAFPTTGPSSVISNAITAPSFTATITRFRFAPRSCIRSASCCALLVLFRASRAPQDISPGSTTGVFSGRAEPISGNEYGPTIRTTARLLTMSGPAAAAMPCFRQDGYRGKRVSRASTTCFDVPMTSSPWPSNSTMSMSTRAASMPRSSRSSGTFISSNIHGNNLGGKTPFNFPAAPEITFLNKRFFLSAPPLSRLKYPVAGLDRPNHPRFPEFTFEF